MIVMPHQGLDPELKKGKSKIQFVLLNKNYGAVREINHTRFITLLIHYTTQLQRLLPLL